MTPNESVDWLHPTSWKETTAAEKLALLKQVRENLSRHTDELVRADCEMKGIRHGDEDNIHQEGTAIQSCVIPVGGRINACIDLYESLVDGKCPVPSASREPTRALTCTSSPGTPRTRPSTSTEGTTFESRAVAQANPLNWDGASSPFWVRQLFVVVQMINGLFLDNCAVVHKPHHLNEKSDVVWGRIMKPLVDRRALSFCDSNGGRALVNDRRLKKIYFRWRTRGKAIMNSTSTEFVAECGGNNLALSCPATRRGHRRSSTRRRSSPRWPSSIAARCVADRKPCDQQALAATTPLSGRLRPSTDGLSRSWLLPQHR
jgi:hypothetical protein